ncbi:MAG: hypothetical protein ABSC15_24270, partial [Terriglobales bacterium]
MKITHPVPRRDNDLLERSCRGQREEIERWNCAGEPWSFGGEILNFCYQVKALKACLIAFLLGQGGQGV